jgi:phage baseplate assembly protein W
MADAWHQFGADLAVGATGDVLPVDGSLLGQQRVLRRLLTNPGDYIWSPGYGAGLARFVGQPASAARIEAVIRSQILQEAAVAQTPAPVVAVTADNAGTVYVELRYADAATGATQSLTFSVPALSGQGAS